MHGIDSLFDLQVVEHDEEFRPLAWEDIVKEVGPLLLRDCRVLDAIDRKLLQVPDVELPA